MRIAIIQFPGSNCESESIRAIEQAGMTAEEFLWNRNPDDLANFDGYFIVGGFSYEDRSRSGVIASLDPLIPYLRIESEKGKPVLGICNGAQILVETGMVPGLKEYQIGMALAVNKRVKDGKVLGTGFYNTWVNIQLATPNTASAFTRHLQQGDFIHVPVAHGEGRFIIPDTLLDEMKTKHLTTFQYCDKEGQVIPEFPINPNGSMYNLAAVSNPNGNVMAMMPHPERTENGQPIFTSMRDYIAEEKRITLETLNFTPRRNKPLQYVVPMQSVELLTSLIITDNEAATVKQALENREIYARIERETHWEIELGDEADNEKVLKKVIASGELFNANKECSRTRDIVPPDTNRVSLLVRYRDDFVGQSKKQRFVELGLDDVKRVTKGTVWHISIERGNIDQIVEYIMNTNILCNPYSQVMYYF